MRLRQKHAIPAVVTSTGHVSRDAPLCAGPAEALTGLARYREVYARGRLRFGRRVGLRYAWHAYRYGCTLSGSPITVDL